MGAVRGGKFIPDDTDADIMVDEREWDKLNRELRQGMKGTKMCLRDAGNPKVFSDDASAIKQVYTDPYAYWLRLFVSCKNEVHVDIYRYRVCVSRPARTHTACGSTHTHINTKVHTHTHTRTHKYTDTDVLCAHAPEQHHRC